MLVHGCGVSQYPQFYDQIKNIYQLLPRPYAGSYKGEKGHQFLKEPWIIVLSKSVETFIMVLINDMTTSLYWQNMEVNEKSKREDS